MSRSRLAALLLVVAAVVSGCVAPPGAPAPQPPAPQPPAQPAKPPKRAVFMAGYKPQANLPFVGVYVAREKGFFKEQNLEVEILH